MLLLHAMETRPDESEMLRTQAKAPRSLAVLGAKAYTGAPYAPRASNVPTTSLCHAASNQGSGKGSTSMAHKKEVLLALAAPQPGLEAKARPRQRRARARALAVASPSAPSAPLRHLASHRRSEKRNM